MPRRKRLAISMAKLEAKPWLAEANDHHSMIMKYPERVPKTSSSFPPKAYIPA